MDELLGQPVRVISESVRNGQTTAKSLTTAVLDRIEKVNPALNAVVHLESEMALKHAERCDVALKGGETPGKLFGVPTTIKDSLDTFDMITTWGTLGRKDFRPGKDASCVARLRNEGAIVVGKTNTPEFTLSFRTDNKLFGRTNNPFNQDHTSGGSSGGAAAIVAAGGSPFEVGTDTGGSIRLPCHFCGTVGIKPTTGRVPCTGNSLPATGLIATLSQPGPIARYVDDLVYLLEIMQGPDNIDPHAIPVPWRDPYDINASNLRVGYHTDNGIARPTNEIAAAIKGVIEILADDGIKASEARPTGVEMSGFIYSTLLAADDGEMVEALLEDCRTTEPSEPVANLLENRRPAIGAQEFAQVISLWENYQSSMLSYFDDFDILICPVNANTAGAHDSRDDFSAFTYTAAYNLTGWPGVVIRAGTDEKGLPIGVQILARPFREDHCLAMAKWLEDKLGPFDPPKP